VRFTAFSLVSMLVPLFADGADISISGVTLADPATPLNFRQLIVAKVEFQSGCHQIETIDTAPMPATETELYEKYAGYYLEVWTVKGCNAEYPMWLAWKPPPAAGVTVAIGLYHWTPRPPN
jgi:hypothetical protein